MLKRKTSFVAILIVFFYIFTFATPVLAKNVTLDENTFNQLVTRAKMADTLEKEKDFYKSKYEDVVKKNLELQALYKEDISLKDSIIARQKDLVSIQLERLKAKDGIIKNQDKRISKLKNGNTVRDILLVGIAAGGIAIAADKGESGAAIGIGAATLLNFLIR